jgi:hypothetical protein
VAEDEKDSLFLDDAGLNAPMRAEAAGRAHSADSWMMAALISTNGGAIAILLSHGEGGLAKIIAAALFVLGTTAALVAGRLSANLAREIENLFICLTGLQQGSQHSFRAAQMGNPAVYQRALELLGTRQEALERQRPDLDKVAEPGPWLGAGVFLFLFGCIAAGFALF